MEDRLGRMLNDGFQATQDLIIGKLEQMDKNIKEIHREVQKVNLNNVDVVLKEEFEKLENRVGDVEEIVDLKLKEA